MNNSKKPVQISWSVEEFPDMSYMSLLKLRARGPGEYKLISHFVLDYFMGDGLSDIHFSCRPSAAGWSA